MLSVRLVQFCLAALIFTGCASKKVTPVPAEIPEDSKINVTTELTEDSLLIPLTMRTHMPRFAQCYRALIAEEGSIEGKMIVRFDVAESGDISSVNVPRSQIPALNPCIIEKVQSIKFPARKERATISYPLWFERDV